MITLCCFSENTLVTVSNRTKSHRIISNHTVYRGTLMADTTGIPFCHFTRWKYFHPSIKAKIIGTKMSLKWLFHRVTDETRRWTFQDDIGHDFELLGNFMSISGTKIHIWKFIIYEIIQYLLHWSYMNEKNYFIRRYTPI